ncbi:MAG: hypothetical protein QOE05_1981 [Actinomycetota bacterium]|nr:hypothetical protein [Actinomycetota bacterium]
MRFRYAVAAGLSAALAASTGVLAPTSSAQPGARTDYLVLFKSTRADDAARSAIARSGGRITEVNAKIGYAYVSSDRSDFAASMTRTGTVAGVAAERTIGSARDPRPKARDVERVERERASASGHGRADAKPGRRGRQAVTPEPLAGLQWDMRQIDATATGSYAKDTGTKKVKVGIIDTGVDGSHPDIAANFDKAGIRNFVTDMTDIDGPCEHPSCVDPVDEDDDGHGTHVASTIGSPINGLGVAGVAPNVSLLNIRAGQDSGYFFLQPTLQALTYAGDSGVDVVNMSFYIDPWLYNCVDNPADSPAEQAEQRTVRAATQRAVNYATHRGVLPVSAMGNEATDLNSPTFDPTSPDYPVDAAKDRTVDNSCITVPTETKGVVAVSSTGPSTRKAYYSNYGTEQTDVAAPGGDVYDTTDNHRDARAGILAAYPAALAKANGDLNPDGTPNNEFVVRDCKGTVCAYYQYLQGTSMAAPHAVGVAALVVSHNGKRDRSNGGLGLPTGKSQALLYKSAQPHACPQPRLFHYTRILVTGEVVEDAHRCEGPRSKNGFYGRGILNANAAVRH